MISGCGAAAWANARDTIRAQPLGIMSPPPITPFRARHNSLHRLVNWQTLTSFPSREGKKAKEPGKILQVTTVLCDRPERRRSHGHQHGGWILELFDNDIGERGSDSAIDDAMIEGQRQVDEMGRPNPVLGVENLLFDDPAQPQDANFRMIDDGSGKEAADAPDRRERKSATVRLSRRDFPCLASFPSVSISRAMVAISLRSASGMTGTISPFGVATAIPRL